MSRTPPSFGRLLTDARGDRTQEAVRASLSERGTVITRQALQHWEHNRAPTPAPTIGALAEVYGLTADQRLALLEASMVPLAARPDDVPDGRCSADDGDAAAVA